MPSSEPPPTKPETDRLDEIAAELEPPDSQWERPTAAKLRRIERRGPPATYPPSSSERPGKHWTPAGVVLVFTAFGAMCVTVGGVVGPILVKPDLSGYVKEERLTKCEAKLEAREDAHEKASEELRRQTGKCYQALGDCRSQNGAQGQVIESMETKRRR